MENPKPISLPPNLALETLPQSDSRPAQEQVSSTGILEEAHELKQSTFNRPKQTIQDLDELRLFQLVKRKEYEQQLNKNRLNFGQWMRYAKWEIDHNHDFKRARSIMERALAVNIQHVPFWVRYVELELLHKNIEHARNVLDRAVTTLPRTDKLWFMYVQTEEALGNYAGVRSVFERWLTWKPEKSAWESYIAFEQRYDEWDNARALYLRYITEHPNDSDMWMKWTVFETSEPPVDLTQIARTRGVFEAALDTLMKGPEFKTNKEIPLLVAHWATWETSMREMERARAIYSTLLDRDLLSKQQKTAVFQHFAEYERKYGTSFSVDSTVHLKRKLQYEQVVSENPHDYDSWWELSKMEDSSDSLRNLLHTAVNTPPTEKTKLTLWRRYVFLWIKLALWEEYAQKDVENARKTWKAALEAIPHSKFTFAKLWIMSAEFELRNSDLTSARKILGRGIGQSCREKPKPKLLKYYIALETKLGEWDRVRKLYEKWLELSLTSDQLHGEGNSLAVLQDFIAFEYGLGESDRCIALYKLGTELGARSLEKLDASVLFTPAESLLTSYIEFLKDELRYDDARAVYRETLARNPSAKVWIALALFESTILSPAQMETLEASTGEEVQFTLDSHHLGETRKVFEEAFKQYRALDDAENSIRILEAWKQYEESHGTEEDAARVEKKMPTAITKRRQVDGIEEVFVDYVFPETVPNLSKFLANAQKWAQKNA